MYRQKIYDSVSRNPTTSKWNAVHVYLQVIIPRFVVSALSGLFSHLFISASILIEYNKFTSATKLIRILCNPMGFEK